MPTVTRHRTLRVCLFAGVFFIILTGVAIPALAKAKGPVTFDSAPSQFVDLDGLKIHYRNYGRGSRAIVFVHGWCGDMSVWKEQVPKFAARNHVILIDLPGHGKSDKPHIVYSMSLFGRVVEEVARRAGARKLVLVGHSMGVPIIREIYRTDPRKVLAFVAVDGALRMPIDDSTRVERLVEPLRNAGYAEEAGRMMDNMASQTSDEVRAHLREVAMSTPQHVMVSSMERMFEKDVWKDDAILVPLLALVPKQRITDDYKVILGTIALENEIRGIDGVGHFLMLEKPAEFNSILSRFLLDHNAARF